MSFRAQARIGVLVTAALVVGLVGPCPCGPTAAVNQASRGCCDAETGLKPVSLDCCAGCFVSLRGPESGLPSTSTPGAVVASAPRGAAPILRPAAAPFSLRLDTFVVPSPPAILRV